MDKPSQEAEEILRICKDAAAKIRELACTVQIFVTLHEPDNNGGHTLHMTTGLGNWYARESQIREWVIENKERIKLGVRRELEEE